MLSRSSRSLWIVPLVSFTTVLSGCSILSQEPQVRVIEIPQPPKPLPEALREPCKVELDTLEIGPDAWEELSLQEQVQSIVEYVSESWAAEAKKCALKHEELVKWYNNNG